jgi:ssRNA-specific RNase YbeY (16S rRNA maturation enzyme)
MAGGGIHFFSEDTSFQIRQKLLLRSWIRETVAEEGHLTSHLNFIFCSDEYLLRMNREYLNHDTYTDILTFDNSEVPGKISGDIFISIDRVKITPPGLVWKPAMNWTAL